MSAAGTRETHFEAGDLVRLFAALASAGVETTDLQQARASAVLAELLLDRHGKTGGDLADWLVPILSTDLRSERATRAIIDSWLKGGEGAVAASRETASAQSVAPEEIEREPEDRPRRRWLIVAAITVLLAAAVAIALNTGVILRRTDPTPAVAERADQQRPTDRAPSASPSPTAPSSREAFARRATEEMLAAYVDRAYETGGIVTPRGLFDGGWPDENEALVETRLMQLFRIAQIAPDDMMRLDDPRIVSDILPMLSGDLIPPEEVRSIVDAAKVAWPRGPAYDLSDALLASGAFRLFLARHPDLDVSAVEDAAAIDPRLGRVIDDIGRRYPQVQPLTQARIWEAAGTTLGLPLRFSDAPWRQRDRLSAGGGHVFALISIFLVLAAAVTAPLLMALNRRGFLHSRLRTSAGRLHRLATGERVHVPDAARVFARASRLLLMPNADGPAFLDVRSSVRATALAGGLVRPVFRRGSSRIGLLALIQSRGVDDFQRRSALEYGRRLQGYGVDVLIFFLEGGRNRIRPERGGVPLSLSQLGALYPRRALVYMGDAAALVEGATGRPKPWCQAFDLWETRVALTPIAPGQWAREERTVANRLGMPILPLSPRGLLTYAYMFSAQEGDTGPGMAGPALPPVLGRGDWIWTDNSPPPVGWRVLEGQLRDYLGKTGFTWLQALAPYPAVQWDLTCYIGLSVRNEDGDALFDDDVLLRFSQLPWFRTGRMPEWLREKLLATLPPGTHIQIAGLIADLQRQAAEEGARGNLKLNIETEGAKRIEDDEIFVRFLTGRRQGHAAAIDRVLRDKLLPPLLQRLVSPAPLAVAVFLGTVFLAQLVLLLGVTRRIPDASVGLVWVAVWTGLGAAAVVALLAKRKLDGKPLWPALPPVPRPTPWAVRRWFVATMSALTVALTAGLLLRLAGAAAWNDLHQQLITTTHIGGGARFSPILLGLDLVLALIVLTASLFALSTGRGLGQTVSRWDDRSLGAPRQTLVTMWLRASALALAVAAALLLPVVTVLVAATFAGLPAIIIGVRARARWRRAHPGETSDALSALFGHAPDVVVLGPSWEARQVAARLRDRGVRAVPLLHPNALQLLSPWNRRQNVILQLRSGPQWISPPPAFATWLFGRNLIRYAGFRMLRSEEVLASAAAEIRAIIRTGRVAQ